MNNKGFTLVELLGVVVILSVIGVIAYTSVLGYINNSKKKAEEKFLDEISTEIESYLGLYGMNNFIKDGEYEFSKYGINVKVNKLKLNDGSMFTLNKLIVDLKMTDRFQNPRTEGICNGSNIEIEVYKDQDYVYYYYVNMTEDNGCTALKNIDTRPDNLKNVLCSEGVTNAC